MTGDVRVGDVGTVFEATVYDDNVAVDLTAATQMNLIFKKPDGSTMTKTAVLSTNGRDGKIRYTSVAGDIDQEGIWEVQGLVVSSTGTWKTTTYRYRVEPNL